LGIENPSINAGFNMGEMSSLYGNSDPRDLAFLIRSSLVLYLNRSCIKFFYLKFTDLGLIHDSRNNAPV